MVECTNCGDYVTMQSPQTQYCLDCLECPSCGNGREVTATGLMCSWCQSDRMHRILDQSPVEDGDMVWYDGYGTEGYEGNVWYVEIGPQISVFLYPATVAPSEWSIGDPETAWPIVRSIEDVEPVALRYEVRLAHEEMCDPAEVDSVWYGFDCYSEAKAAARSMCRTEDLPYRVWDTETGRFVQHGDGVVRKDDPAVTNPRALSDEEQEEVRREEHARAVAWEREHLPDA